MPNAEMFAIVAEQLQDGRNVKVSVLGRSMRPFYSSGRAIVLHPITPEAVRWGNVVLAKISSEPVHYAVHRIIAVEGERITLMGDGNPRGVEVVDRDEIYGYIEWRGVALFCARVWYWLRPVRWILIGVDRRLFK